jgi:tetratricopeptide (TPR) repeat protein
MEGGSNIPRGTVVVLECGSQEQRRVSVDSQGRFSLLVEVPTFAGATPWTEQAGATNSWSDCSLHGVAAGYQSSAVNLAGEQPNGVVQVGTIIMSPVSGDNNSENFTVSVASLSAPANAKKAFDKGQEQAKKGRWAAATDYFKKAIQVYPRYALAYLEMGRAQIQQNNFVDAQRSLQQAATQDSSLLPAYIELAKLEATQKEWKALSEATAKMVELAPDSSAMFWFLDSAANYNLHELERAEKSAARGLRLDQGHRVPQLEYLYGLILGARQDYTSAVQHISSYLRLAPRAHDAKLAQQALTDFQHSAGSAAATAANR